MYSTHHQSTTEQTQDINHPFDKLPALPLTIPKPNPTSTPSTRQHVPRLPTLLQVSPMPHLAMLTRAHREATPSELWRSPRSGGYAMGRVYVLGVPGADGAWGKGEGGITCARGKPSALKRGLEEMAVT